MSGEVRALWQNTVHWEPKSVSVIIPTYNRAQSLKTTLDSLLNQDYPSDRLEIIVVDNCSTDGTKEVVQVCQAQAKLPVKYVYEDRPGAHFARNTGARHASGQLLYFTDDDMIADPGLLANLVPVFDVFQDVGSATGSILPKWETEPPRWLAQHCPGSIMGLQMRPETVVISEDDVGVYSGHMGVLRDVFFRSGGFRPDIVGDETLGNNEVGLNMRVKELGYKFAYVRQAKTYHVIPASRLTQTYLNGRMAHQGSFECYGWYKAQEPGSFRLALGMAEQLVGMVQAGSQSVLRMLLIRDTWRISHAKIHYRIGRMRCCWGLLRDPSLRQLTLKDDWLT
ncbi:MAG TPA: glycosyltransferase family A protein [bacterium]|nr:glycosyltransferase family A protein [bacterium]